MLPIFSTPPIVTGWREGSCCISSPGANPYRPRGAPEPRGASAMLRMLAPFLCSSRMAVRWLWSSISQLLLEQAEEAVGVGVALGGAANDLVALGRRRP